MNSFEMKATFVWIADTQIKICGEVGVSDVGNGLLRFELLEDITKRDDDPPTRRHWASQLGAAVEDRFASSVTAHKGTVFYSHVSFVKVIR